MSLTFAASFWGQVDLWPSPNWPTLVTAFTIGFLACHATLAVADMVQVRRTGALPWDKLKRGTSRRRFWTYVAMWVSVAVGCGIIAAAASLIPLGPVIAGGVAPTAALKLLGGGTVEDGKQAKDDPDAKGK